MAGTNTGSEEAAAPGGRSIDPGSLGERLAIVGGGAIACGLAATAACHGDVVLWTRSSESARRTRDAMHAACRKHVAEAATRVRITTDLEEVAEASFLVESIAEDQAAKEELLGRLGERASREAVLATTTSALPVDELAAASGRPERFVAFHPFNPVARMQLIELAFPTQAAAEVRERTYALCRALGKTAVEVPAVPGFVVNRLLFPYLFSAVRLLDETGMDPAEIDACMRMGAGHPMGPLALLDFVGLDVAVAIGEAIGAEVPDRLRALVAEGALGRKAGRGLHDYRRPSS